MPMDANLDYWLEGRGRVFLSLREHGLAYVCVDESQGFRTSVSPVVAATANVGVVRFHGHN